MTWIAENLWIFLAVGLAALLGIIAYCLYKSKKAGNSSCGCGCQNCAMRDKCHPKENEN